MKLLEEDTYSPLKEERSCNDDDGEKLDRKTVDAIFATSLVKRTLRNQKLYRVDKF